MSQCKDCKHNKKISCLVCIKDKIYYVGIDLGKGDMIKIGKGLVERNKITTIYDNKISLKDIREYTNRLEKRMIRK